MLPAIKEVREEEIHILGKEDMRRKLQLMFFDDATAIELAKYIAHSYYIERSKERFGLQR